MYVHMLLLLLLLYCQVTNNWPPFPNKHTHTHTHKQTNKQTHTQTIKQTHTQIWKPRRTGRRARWQEQHTLLFPIDQQQLALAKRRRRAPPTVHTLAAKWTCDDQRLLVTDSVFRLHVYDAVGGNLLHTLKGHGDKAHVLAVHPTDGCVAMTAGYDGLVVMWDVQRGCELKRFVARWCVCGVWVSMVVCCSPINTIMCFPHLDHT